MNDLVTVRTIDLKISLVRREFNHFKNIKLYLNDLINPERYLLTFFGSKRIEVYKIIRESSLFYGSIRKEKNKKLFSTLSILIRLRDE